MVVRRGPLSRVDKVAAWSISGLCLIAGSVGMALAVIHLHWRLGLVSGGVLVVGVVYAVSAARGRV